MLKHQSLLEMEEIKQMKKWSDYTWDDWIPEEVRNQIIDFWCEDWRRGPEEWQRDSVVQKSPKHGDVVTLKKLSVKDEWIRGRYVHAWNNIGRLVHDDGSFSYVYF